MRLLKKIKNTSGFSLAESLIALGVIACLTVGIVGCINAAANIYKESLFESESQALSATLDIALEDVLKFSSDVKTDGGVVKFTNGNYGVKDGHFLVKDHWLYMNLSDTYSDGEANAPLNTLLNGGMYTTMEISDFEIAYDETEKAFSVSYKLRSIDRPSLENSYTFYVSII